MSLKRLHVKQLATIAPDAAYLNRLQGLQFGVAAKLGVQRESTFVDASRRVAFTLPNEWYAFGDGDEIIAASGDNESIVRIKFERRTKDETLRDALKRMTRFDKVTYEPLSGGAAKGELANISADEGAQVAAYAAIDLQGQRLYCKGLALGAEAWGKNRVAVLALIRSLRTPIGKEASIEPLRIAIEKATIAGALTPVPAFREFPQENTEILNQLFPQGRVQAGQLIKVVR
jgi:predicted Zn-dependent protease